MAHTLEELRGMTLPELEKMDRDLAAEREAHKAAHGKVARVIAEKMEAAEAERLEADAAAQAAAGEEE